MKTLTLIVGAHREITARLKSSHKAFPSKDQHERGRLTASTGSVMRAGRISFLELDAASALAHADF
jgi:hypothetical protein